VYKERDGVVGKDDMKKPYKIVPTILKPPHIFFGTLAVLFHVTFSEYHYSF
jgi:hypothetical protein